MNETRLYFKVTNARQLYVLAIVLISVGMVIATIAEPSTRWSAVGLYALGGWSGFEAHARFEDGWCRSVRERVRGELKTPPLNQYKGVYRGDNE